MARRVCSRGWWHQRDGVLVHLKVLSKGQAGQAVMFKVIRCVLWLSIVWVTVVFVIISSVNLYKNASKPIIIILVVVFSGVSQRATLGQHMYGGFKRLG